MTKKKSKLQRALLVIEKIAVLENPEETNTAWNDVYKLAHAFGNHCKNPHEGWKNELDEFEENLKNF